MIEVGATYAENANGYNAVKVIKVSEKSVTYSVDNGRYNSWSSHAKFLKRHPVLISSEFGEWEATAETNLADRKI